MSVLVTGVAGFIGSHVASALLENGERVVGLDNLNSYYDVRLKKERLARLHRQDRFRFVKGDISQTSSVAQLGYEHSDIDRVVHLAAQAGVRHSLSHPKDYVRSNLVGHLNMLEFARRVGSRLKHFVYASSSSVYGGGSQAPFSVEERADTPLSLYAATKRADELMTHSYCHLFGFPATGLRFFTVYGPWGRPDMSAYIFTRQIIDGERLSVFNHGRMKRDFTYIDDIVAGVLSALYRPPLSIDGSARHAVFNLGNDRSERLMDFIGIIERAVGRKAKIDLQPMQPGDVAETHADIAASREVLGFEPRVTIEEGIPRFVAWYREYHEALSAGSHGELERSAA